MIKKRIQLLFSLALFVVAANHTLAQTPEDDKIGAPLPNFSFPEISGGNLSILNVKPEAPVLVFYFDPDCDHCQEQGKMLAEKMNLFADFTIIFVAYSTNEAIAGYKKEIFGDLKRDYFYFCSDPKYQFDKFFGYSQAPTLHLYGKDWKKVKVFRNEIAPEEILKLVK